MSTETSVSESGLCNKIIYVGPTVLFIDFLGLEIDFLFNCWAAEPLTVCDDMEAQVRPVFVSASCIKVQKWICNRRQITKRVETSAGWTVQERTLNASHDSSDRQMLRSLVCTYSIQNGVFAISDSTISVVKLLLKNGKS